MDEGGSMPKIKHIIAIIALVALVLLAGCGTGDKGPVGRVSPQELVSGSSGTGGGPGGGGTGGGGGGGVGACVVSGTCVNNLDAASCSGAGGQLHAGATCQSLGYTTCSTYQGYEVCY